MPFTKKYLWIGGIVLLFLILLGWYFYHRGKKQVTLQYLPGELAGNPGSGNVIGASNDEIKRIATDLYGDMNGFNLYGHNYTPYQQAIQLGDGDLIKLYNTYNKQYQGEHSETLTQMISNERYTFPEVPGLIIARLKKLNCL